MVLDHYAYRALFWLLKVYLYYYSITPYFSMSRHWIELTEQFMGPPLLTLGLSMCCEALDTSSPFLDHQCCTYHIIRPTFLPSPPLFPHFSPPFSLYIFLPARALPLLPFFLPPPLPRGPSSAIIFPHEYDPRHIKPFCNSSFLNPKKGTFPDFPPIPNRRLVDQFLFLTIPLTHNVL